MSSITRTTEEEERKYLKYRSSIRGLTEGLDLSILLRLNKAATMPASYMVCRNGRDYDDDSSMSRISFVLLASFCSQEGCYAFLRQIVKFVRQTNGGRITRESWDSLDLEAALQFAREECERHAVKAKTS